MKTDMEMDISQCYLWSPKKWTEHNVKWIYCIDNKSYSSSYCDWYVNQYRLMHISNNTIFNKPVYTIHFVLDKECQDIHIYSKERNDINV